MQNISSYDRIKVKDKVLIFDFNTLKLDTYSMVSFIQDHDLMKGDLNHYDKGQLVSHICDYAKTRLVINEIMDEILEMADIIRLHNVSEMIFYTDFQNILSTFINSDHIDYINISSNMFISKDIRIENEKVEYGECFNIPELHDINEINNKKAIQPILDYIDRYNITVIVVDDITSVAILSKYLKSKTFMYPRMAYNLEIYNGALIPKYREYLDPNELNNGHEYIEYDPIGTTSLEFTAMG